jgi:hypothetical protein
LKSSKQMQDGTEHVQYSKHQIACSGEAIIILTAQSGR